MLEKRYLKVVFPSSPSIDGDFLQDNARYGGPKVYVVDAEGNEEYEVRGIVGASVSVREGEFMQANLEAIMKIELPEG